MRRSGAFSDYDDYREKNDVIRLSVIAKDHGNPSRESSALIELTLTDVNDNAPVFESVRLFAQP